MIRIITLLGLCWGPAIEGNYRNPCFFFFFGCSVSFVVGSLKDEPGRRVSE